MTTQLEAPYDPELAKLICEDISQSAVPLNKIAKKHGLRWQAIFTWRYTVPEFDRMYMQAKEDQADFLAEEVLEIADADPGLILGSQAAADGLQFDVVRVDGSAVAHQRLRVDARKWAAGKLKPKKYGDKVETTLTGDPDRPVYGKILIEGVSVGPRTKNTDT